MMHRLVGVMHVFDGMRLYGTLRLSVIAYLFDSQACYRQQEREGDGIRR